MPDFLVVKCFDLFRALNIFYSAGYFINLYLKCRLIIAGIRCFYYRKPVWVICWAWNSSCAIPLCWSVSDIWVCCMCFKCKLSLCFLFDSHKRLKGNLEHCAVVCVHVNKGCLTSVRVCAEALCWCVFAGFQSGWVEILQRFGTRSDITNQTYTNINESFFPSTREATCGCCFCPSGVKGSSVPLLWFPSSLIFEPSSSRFHSFPRVIPLKGPSGLFFTETNALWTVTPSSQWRVWSDPSPLHMNQTSTVLTL